MIRVLFDEHGAYTNDLFVKIDASPSQVLIADTTWLSDFFGTLDPSERPPTDEQIMINQKNNVALFIRLWIKVLTSDQQVCFVPVNMTDQGSVALQITKAKSLFQVSTVYTTNFIDGTPEAYFMANQLDNIWQIDIRSQWAIAPKSILTGLNWSLDRLQSPTVPLYYE